MIRWDSFARSVLFAAVAAATSVAWLVVAGPLVGGRRAVALFLIGACAAYLGGLVPDARRRCLAAAAAAAVGLAGYAVAPGLVELALGLAVVLGVTRSVFLYPANPLRSVLREATLLVGGLAFAQALAGPSMRGLLIGVWAFFLAQSFFFLGLDAGPRRTAPRDPFETAYGRATALLDRGW